MPDAADGRRLRFDIDVQEGESIAGAIARGVREHVLVRTAPVLAAAGVDLKHIGLSQLATHAELRRLAFAARCDAALLIARAGQRIVPEGGGRSMDARFGRLVMPWAHLELDRRRIGPSTLQARPFHRLSWMNLLLPYCPESLERLVDQCPRCDGALGWRRAVGIGHCDQCWTEIPPSDAPGLPDAPAGDYRLFALLSSPDPDGVERAMRLLPEALSDVPPGALVRLALRKASKG